MADQPGKQTKQEILAQPAGWAGTLEIMAGLEGDLARLWRDERPDHVVLTGCGTPYYAAQVVAGVLQSLTGVPSRAVPASELLLYRDSALPAAGRVLMVALSRSGSTSETVRAGREFLASGRGPLVTLSGFGEEPLAGLGAVNAVLPALQDRSVVQTRAFTAMTIAALAATAARAGRPDLTAELQRLPEAGRRVLERHLPAIDRLVARGGVERFFFLGSGPQHGYAGEAALKAKEVSLTPAEPFHFMEFRHGPMSLVTPETLVVGFLGKHDDWERPVMAQMAAFGGQTLTLGEADADLALDSGLGEIARGPLLLPAIQWLVCERAIAAGLDPDHPRNLSAVVKLEI